MSHLTDERLTALAFESIDPTPAEAAHLGACPDCAQVYAELTLLASELSLAARSQPSANATQRYYSLFDQVQQQPHGLKALWRELIAALIWDSRQQPGLQGARSVAATEYRLLYSAGSLELELMVEMEGTHRHIEGDLIAANEDVSAPALVELIRLNQDDGAPLLFETETDSGRFHFQNIPPGRYRLAVTSLPSQVVIEPLEIT